MVGRTTRGDATLERLVELTLGQKAETAFSRAWRAQEPGEVVLEARGLTVGARLRDVDLTVRRGEIVSLCGLLGARARTSSPAPCAATPGTSAAACACSAATACRARPREAVRQGAALISENRKEEGLFPDLSVRANVSMASLGRVVVAPLVRLIGPRAERRATASAAERTGIALGVLGRAACAR